MIQYIISNNNTEEIAGLALQALDCGCRWVEIKADPSVADSDITAVVERIKPQFVDADAFLILADRVECTKNAGAAGVHIYHNDLPVSAARVTLEAEPIIGVSVYTPEEAATLKGYDIDLIYYTTKTDSADEINKIATVMQNNKLELPLVAIGKFDDKTIRDIIAAGASGVALSSTDTSPECLKNIIEQFNKP